METIIHLAAKAGVRPSIESISDHYGTNVMGTVNLLENNVNLPFSENDNVDSPSSPYASTKKKW